MSSGLPKNYKIIVDSKHFGNMKGIRPAEVAKKAASKILGLSNNRNRITQFSIIETKNRKIRNYKAFKENLIRPYKKNGKLIKYRIIVKKIGKHTGGNLLEIYKKNEFSEEDIKKIKDEMLIVFDDMSDSKVETKYEPYNLTETNLRLIDRGIKAKLKGVDFLELGENDPIRQFFPIEDFNIEIVLDEHYGKVGHMKLSYKKIDNHDKKECKIFYEFTGNEDWFELHIYNLESFFNKITETDASNLLDKWEYYIRFLRKLYPRAVISFNFYSNVPSPSNRNNGTGILKVPISNELPSSLTRNEQIESIQAGLGFYSLFKKNNSNNE